MNTIKFLGTAGARFVVSKQVRASGGMWFSLADTNFLLDPGPGTLVRALASRPKLDPTTLDGIILSHKHLDHSADINVMIEAMTEGGFKRRGAVFAPADAFENDPVIFKYLRGFVERIGILKEGGSYTIGNVKFTTPVKHIHPVETYGMNFNYAGPSISFIPDTLFFPELASHYQGDAMIINALRLKLGALKVDHLTMDDVREIIAQAKPRLALLTHFGMGVLRAKPGEIAARMQAELGINVIAARDGMLLNLDELDQLDRPKQKESKSERPD